jgi:transcriptional regulator with XRE-family HTH domain
MREDMKAPSAEESIAMKLMRVVEESGLQRSQIARDAGLSYASIHAWLNGLRAPTPGSLRQLAGGLRTRCGLLQDLATEIEQEATKREQGSE